MSILEEIHCTRRNLPKDLQKHIVIDPIMRHYPHNSHTKYDQWNWCKDEFVPPLTEKELKLYIKKPSIFAKNLIDNLKMYIRFCHFLIPIIQKTENHPPDKRVIGHIVMLFLFQSAMDNHYYRYDYLLDLEEYPNSPLGWHYLRIKSLLEKTVKFVKRVDQNTWVNEKLLYLLGGRKEVLTSLQRLFSKSDFKKLFTSFLALQIYLKVQQKEELLFYGKNQQGPIFKTGRAIWESFRRSVKESQALVRDNEKLLIYLNGDPIVGTRKILVDLDTLFTAPTVGLVRQEVNGWQMQKSSRKL